MFTLTKLLATFAALVVVPTISYVIGQTIPESPTLPESPKIQQRSPMPTAREAKEGFFSGKENEENPSWTDPSNEQEDEQRQRMEELRQKEEEHRQQEDENRRAQEESRQLKRMKQDVKRANRPLAMLESKAKRLEAQKITVPMEVKEFIAQMKSALRTVAAAQNFEEAQEVMEALSSASQDFQDHFDTLRRLDEWKAMSARAKSEIRKQEIALKRYQANAKRKGAFDITEQLNAFSEYVIGLKATLVKAEKNLSAGNGEEALQELEDEFLNKVDEAADLHRTLQALSDIRTHLQKVPKEIARFKREITQLKRRKIDTSSADALIIQMEAKLGEIKTLTNTKPVDTDALIDAVEAGSQLFEEFDTVRDELSGSREVDKRPKLPPIVNFPSFDTYGQP